MRKIYALLFTVVLFAGANAQVAVTVINPTNTTPNLAASYTSLANAITALSGITAISGPVTLTAAAGTETAPVGGYVINFTAVTTSTNKVVITGTATTTITAFTPQASGNLNDAIFKIIGSDFVTIQNFTMAENGANTTTAAGTNNMTEWGVALLERTGSTVDGSQSNTIQNNTISLSRLYQNSFGIYSNPNHTPTAVTTGVPLTNATGANSFNKFYTNAISNVNFGIVVIGTNALTAVGAMDNGNDIGGSSAGTGNTITNFGGIGVAPSAYSLLTGNDYAIFVNNNYNDNISFNTITSAAGAAQTGAIVLGGILKNYSSGTTVQPTGTITTTINNNTVTLTNAPAAAATGATIGINNQGLSPLLSTATMSINNNTVQNSVISGGGATTGGFTGITNLSIPGLMNMTGNTVSGNTITATTATTAGISGLTNSGAATTLNITGNNIINNSINTASSTSATLLGISNSGAAGTVNMNTNIIRNMSSTAASGQMQGIVNTGAVVTALNINTNQFGNATGGYFTSSVASSGTLFGVSTSSSASTCAVSITGNDIRGITYNVAASAGQTYFVNSAAAFATFALSNNTFTNLTINSTGSVTFLGHSGTFSSTSVSNINGNSIVTAYNKTGAGGTITIRTSSSSTPAGAVCNFQNNTFSNMTFTGAITFVGYFDNDGGAPTKSITGNTFNNNNYGTGAVSQILAAAFNGNNTFISNNTITNQTTNGGAITCINLGGSGTSTSETCANNTITNITSTGTGGSVTGITCASVGTVTNVNNNSISALASTGAFAVTALSVTGGGTTTNVFKNSICDISGSNASSTVNGILVSAGTTVNVHNNRIGDLRTTAANAANPLVGLNITGGTTVNAYYNTVNLAASSSGALFGSSAVSVSTTPTVTFNNNIFANTSSVTGAGLAVAYRRSTATIGTYGGTSDRNDFNATTIYTDGTNTFTAIGPGAGTYKNFVAARDANSISVAPPFLSTTCGNANFLKINTATATQLESGAANIAGITDDFENDIRFGNAGYAGTGTAPDIGADEFNGTPAVVCSGTPAASTINGAAAVCSGTGTTLSLSTTYTDLGITYQWRSATVAGGPYTTTLGTSATQATGNLTVPTYYICEITCNNGGPFTFTTAEKSVLINSLPTITVTPAAASICQPGGSPVTLTASCQIFNVSGTFSQAQEVPPTGSPATGTVSGFINTSSGQMTMTVTFSGLTGNSTAGHIHGPAAAGSNAGVLIDLATIGFPTGVTSGTANGTVTLTAGQVTDLLNGLQYVNIHSTTFGGGEIRAQLAATPGACGATTYTWSPTAGLTPSTGSPVSANPASTTTYTVTGTDVNGCTGTATSTITLAPAVTINSVTATPAVICSGANSQLQVNASVAVTAASSMVYTANTGQALETITTPTVVTIPTSGTIDDGYITVTPGFTFNYVGTNYTSYGVGTNGYVVIGGNSTSIPASITSLAGLNVVYAFGRDGNLNTTNAGNLTHGPAAGGKYVFQMNKYSGGASGAESATIFCTYQIVLWGSTSANPGRIDIIYSTNAGTPATAGTIGIRDAAGTFVNGVNGSTTLTTTAAAWPASGQIYSFTLPAPATFAWTPATFLSSTTIANPVATAVTSTTTYTVTASQGGCSATGNVTVAIGNTWIGTTTDANDAANWTCGLPTSTSDAYIPAVPSGGNMPVLTAALAVRDLNLLGASTISIAANTLSVFGAISGSGTLTGSASSNVNLNGLSGTVKMTPTNASTRSLNNLTLGATATATIGSALDIFGTIDLETSPGGNLNLNGQSVTLKSTATGTARVGKLTPFNASVLGGATVVTVERYINSNVVGRKWHLLSGVSTTTAQTIRASWQEGGGSPTTPNIGTWITAPLTPAGYDSASASSSLLRHDPTAPAWVQVAATNAGNINAERGYFLFVRGDRYAYSTNALQAQTVLRTTGALNLGTQPAVTVLNASPGYTIMGNPYASPIDLENVLTNVNLGQFFYVWDASVLGNNNVGKFRLVQKTGAGAYTATPSSPNDASLRYIHSGQAFMLKATGADASVVLDESHKTNLLSVINPIVGTAGNQQIYTEMLVADPGTTEYVTDAVRVWFNDAFSAGTGDDILKMGNFSDNISSYREGKKLIVENRPMIGRNDTIFLRTSGLSIHNYRLRINTFDFVQTNVKAWLQDTWLNTSTPLELDGNMVNVDFKVTSDPASFNPDRFRIVFAAAAPVPAAFTSVKAAQQNTNIAVEWKVTNQGSIATYEVEKSTDGVNYTKVYTQTAGSTTDGTYNWLDVNPVLGDNYYRIRSIGISNEIKISQVVKVTMGKGISPSITVYPNPVVNKNMSVLFTNMDQGVYQLRLINTSGSVVSTQQLTHSGGNAVQAVPLSRSIAAGIYRLEIINPDKSRSVRAVVITNQ